MDVDKVRAARKIAWEVVKKGSPLTFTKMDDILLLLGEADEFSALTPEGIFESLEAIKIWMVDVLNTMSGGVAASKLNGAIDHLEIVLKYFEGGAK